MSLGPWTNLLRRALVAVAWVATVVAGLQRPSAATEPAYGERLVRRYALSDQGGTPINYDVAINRHGELLVANYAGLFRFDGNAWARSGLPDNTPVRTVVEGTDGVVYVAGLNALGRLLQDERGKSRYVDMRPDFALGDTDIRWVWETFALTSGVVFETDDALLFAGFDGRRERWERPEGLRRLFAINDVLYGRIDGLGFGQISATGFEALPGGKVFADQPLAAAVEAGDELLLISEQGFYLAGANGIRRADRADHYELAIDPPNAAARLSDGTLAVGTDGGQLLVFSAELSLLERIEVARGAVLALAPDRELGVWIATEAGLYRVPFPSPWTLIDERHGLSGLIRDLALDTERLWVGTSAGVYGLEQMPMGLASVAVFPLELGAEVVFPVSDGLLVGDDAGLLWIDTASGEIRRILESGAALAIDPSRSDPQRVFFHAANAIYAVRRSASGWSAEAVWEGPQSTRRYATPVANNEFLIASEGKISRWSHTLGSREALVEIDPPEGSEQLRDCQLATDADAALPVFMCASGPVRWIDNRLEAVAGDGLPPSMNWSEAAEIVVDHEEALIREGSRVFAKRKGGTWQSMTIPTLRPQQVQKLGQVQPGLYWVQSYTQALLLRLPTEAPGNVARQVAIRGVDIRREEGDRIILDTIDEGVTLSHGDIVNVDVQLVSLAAASEMRYRIGNDNDAWSDWIPAGMQRLSITPATAGRTLLTMEGRSADGALVKPASLALNVLPAWWQRPWVVAGIVIAAILLLALVGWAFAVWRTRAIAAARLRLERLVEERTTALIAKSAELSRSHEALRASHEALQVSSRRADLIYRALNDALVGEVIDGRYTLDRFIAAGGYGSVYQATHLELGTRAAIKIFKPLAGEDREQALARFRDEGSSTVKVRHRNVVQVYDFATYLDAVVYLAMEYVEGESLEKRLQRGGRLPVSDAVSILVPVCEALATAHAAGVVHRDVKPANILLAQVGDTEVVKLIDFGIAKFIDDRKQSAGQGLTEAGLVVGTPAYVAPERLTASAYDGRADVYAVGIMAYEMLAGRRPFQETERDAMALALRVINAPPPPLGELAPHPPEGVVSVIMRALEKNPHARPTAEQLGRALKEAALNLP